MPLPDHCIDHDRPNCARCADDALAYHDPAQYEAELVNGGIRITMSDSAQRSLLTFCAEQDDNLWLALVSKAQREWGGKIESPKFEAIGPRIFQLNIVAGEPGAADVDDYRAVDAAMRADEARGMNSENRRGR